MAGGVERWVPVVVSLMFAAVPATEAGAQPAELDLQRQGVMGVGLLANFPNVFTGVSLYALSPRFPVGLYMDAKLTFASSPRHDPNFAPTRTPSQAEQQGHVLASERSLWRVLNVGLVRATGSETAIYLAGGVARGEEYREFLDLDLFGSGEDPYYWTEVSFATRPNLAAGLLFRSGRYMMFQVGGEIFPLGGVIGVSFAW